MLEKIDEGEMWKDIKEVGRTVVHLDAWPAAQDSRARESILSHSARGVGII